MTIYAKKVPTFTPQKAQEIAWESWSGGLNTFSKPTEAKANELVQADNLMLTGVGTPTSRWGSAAYYLAGSGRVRGLTSYYKSTSDTPISLAITDMGYAVSKNGASYSILTGASFASGLTYQHAQLGDNVYIAGATLPLVRFDGNNLIAYTSLDAPVSVRATMLSMASGFTTWSWVITSKGVNGETTGSTARTLASLPLDLTSTKIMVSWNAVSAAASTLLGYEIYRGLPGNETYIASAGPTETQYYDTGTPQSDTRFPPYVNQTGGLRAKYVMKFGDRLVYAGVTGDPSRVYVSGRYPYQDRIAAVDGGGYCYVGPNDGEDITGLGMANIQTTTPLIVVYKESSTYVIALSTIELGNYSILDLNAHLLTSSAGASSGDTIVPVENNTFSFGRKGLYSTGQEAQYLNQIRTNEISARIRPYIQALSYTDFTEACAGYFDYKYLLSFPTKRETMIFDVQRSAFMGPWKTPFGITKWSKYIDSSGIERYLAGCDDGYVREFSASYVSDSGTAIAKLGRTKKEDMGSWNTMKILQYFYFLLRNVRGSITVNLRIEERNGNLVTTKSTTITSSLGNGGWGGDPWGSQPYGQTSAEASITGDELARYAQIYKQMRVVQVEFSASGANSNFEFLGVRMSATNLGPQSLPSSLKV